MIKASRVQFVTIGFLFLQKYFYFVVFSSELTLNQHLILVPHDDWGRVAVSIAGQLDRLALFSLQGHIPVLDVDFLWKIKYSHNVIRNTNPQWARVVDYRPLVLRETRPMSVRLIVLCLHNKEKMRFIMKMYHFFAWLCLSSQVQLKYINKSCLLILFCEERDWGK